MHAEGNRAGYSEHSVFTRTARNHLYRHVKEIRSKESLSRQALRLDGRFLLPTLICPSLMAGAGSRRVWGAGGELPASPPQGDGRGRF